METTIKWEGEFPVRTDTLPCRTNGCTQIFEMRQAVAVGVESRDAALDSLSRLPEMHLQYTCPRCGHVQSLSEFDAEPPILGVRPVVAERTTSRLDWVQIARLVQRAMEFGDMFGSALGRVIVRARALAGRIKAATAALARS